MAKVMLIIVSVFMSISTYAYDFDVDGIYYNIISSTDCTVEVAPKEIGDIYGSIAINANAYSGVVNVPEQVTYKDKTYKVIAIGEGSFMRCFNLEEIVIPNTIKTIKTNAFYGCANLRELRIPKSVTSIQTYTDNYYSVESCFGECSNLESIIVEDGNTVYDSRNNCNALIKTKTNELILCTASSIEIPKTVKVIGAGAFLKNRQLKKLIIPSNITSIDSNAFYGCSDLNELIIEDGKELLNIAGCLLQKYSVIGMFSGSPIQQLYLGRSIQHQWKGGVVTNSPGILFGPELVKISIGASVNTLGPTSDKFFSNSEKITQIDCLNPNPPKGFSSTYAVFYKATLNIPKGSLETYKSHSVWGKFLRIVEAFEISGIENAVGDEAETEVDVYNLQGVSVRKNVKRNEATQDLPQGIYIIDGEKFIVK